MNPEHAAHIHVFDWDGNFLYNFQLNDHIGAIAWDESSGYLYCTDNASGGIIRYDLKEIIEPYS